MFHADLCDRAQLRYLSLHDERYLRCFKGHTKPVVALEMSPKEDLFASAALDDTVRIWDLRSTDCAAALRYSGNGELSRPAVAFDPQGVVLAAAISGGQTKVSDALVARCAAHAPRTCPLTPPSNPLLLLA